MTKNAHVIATGGTFHTPLQTALWLGLTDSVGLLIEHGADFNLYSGCEGGLALSVAVHIDYLDIMKLLVKEEFDLYGKFFHTLVTLQENHIKASEDKNNKAQEDQAIEKYEEQRSSTLSERLKNFAQEKKSYNDEIELPVDTSDQSLQENRALRSRILQ